MWFQNVGSIETLKVMVISRISLLLHDSEAKLRMKMSYKYCDITGALIDSVLSLT